MRFDDRIATVLALPAEEGRAAALRWRQLVDLLAQRRGGAGGAEVERAYDDLRAGRARIPAADRLAAARALAGLRIDPRLLLFFAEDSPAVAAPLLGGARLAAAEWLELLPLLPPPARALLRHRTDLPEEVGRMLGTFGAADLVLEGAKGDAPAAAAAAPAPEAGESQIRELVARIEAFRRARERSGPPPAIPAPRPEPGAPADAFRWETGTDGVILWIEGAPREPLVGQSIAAIAPRGQYGVDGQAAGAFDKRAPFRDARFSVAGHGPASGDWRISGVPYFDPRRGSFLGYRGTARRPRLDEVARAAAASGPAGGLFGTDFAPDSLRQLVHELRTPLNAIIGFAEMIEGQYMGPAAAGYRERAADISGQARNLLAAVEDLDTAARAETRKLELGEGEVDAPALLVRLHEGYGRVAHQRGSALALDIAPGLPPAAVEEAAAERMIARMLAATVGLAREGETIGASLKRAQLGERQMLALTLDRPEAIAGLDEAALLDPGYSPEGDWPAAPALGLGFALRLVRNLAEAAGGALEVGAERLALYLPAAAPLERPAGAGEGQG